MSKRYVQVVEEECVKVDGNRIDLACCDCGLVHEFDFEIVKGKIQFKILRNDRSTSQIRRHNNIKLDKGNW